MKKIFPILLVVVISCGSCSHQLEVTTYSDSEPAPNPKRGSVNLSYHLAVANPANHDIEVSILVEDHNDSSVEFVMPTWAPSRWVRDDFAALVSEVGARGRGARTLRMTRVSANRWRIAAGGEDFVFKYRVHAGRLSDGTSLVNDQGGIINPASVCMYVEGRRDQSIGIYVGFPDSLKWSCFSSLAPGNGANRFLADDYSQLIRSPIVFGRYSEHRVDFGTQVAHIYVSPQGSSLSNEIANGVKELLKESLDYLGTPRIQKDMFLAFSFGLGAENKMQNAGPSNLCIGSSDRLNRSTAQDALLAAASLIPQVRLQDSIQIANYDTANFDHLLVNKMSWFAESMGRYFGLHLLQRTGLMDEGTLRNGLARAINKVEAEPSKRRITLADAAENLALTRDPRHSFLPTNQRNQFFDSYDRGLVSMLLLDLKTIDESDGERDISALVPILEKSRRLLTPKVFLDACAEVGGRGTGILADKLLNDTALREYVELSRGAGFVIDAGTGSRSQLGARLEGTRIVSVARNTSASRAGLQAGDHVARFDGKKINGEVLEAIAAFPTGTSTTITVVRRGSLVTLPISLTEIRRGGFRFEEDPGGNKAKRARFYGNKIAP